MGAATLSGMQGFPEAVHPRAAQLESQMKRTSDEAPGKNLPSRLFASNATLLIGAAFELGMLLGKRTGETDMGKKVRASVADLADKLVDLAPDVIRLVPELITAKPRPARRKAAKK
jgi:hypothetical protein